LLSTIATSHTAIWWSHYSLFPKATGLKQNGENEPEEPYTIPTQHYSPRRYSAASLQMSMQFHQATAGPDDLCVGH
jgi:hypothetical protein